jgi:glyoxylate carboligase
MSYYAMQGFGEYVPVSGFGADIGFDAAAVWSDWLTQTAPRANNAARVIQQALNTLGYSVGAVDGVWGSGSSGAFAQFAKDHNVSVNPSCPGKGGAAGSCPTQDGLVAMQTALASGTKKAGMGMMLGIGIAGAALIAGLVLTAKKRKHFREIRY